jgi:hypothetical protein
MILPSDSIKKQKYMEDVKYLDVNEKQNVTYCIPLWLRDEQVKLSTNRIKNRIETNYELRTNQLPLFVMDSV